MLPTSTTLDVHPTLYKFRNFNPDSSQGPLNTSFDFFQNVWMFGFVAGCWRHPRLWMSNSTLTNLKSGVSTWVKIRDITTFGFVAGCPSKIFRFVAGCPTQLWAPNLESDILTWVKIRRTFTFDFSSKIFGCWICCWMTNSSTTLDVYSTLKKKFFFFERGGEGLDIHKQIYKQIHGQVLTSKLLS